MPFPPHAASRIRSFEEEVRLKYDLFNSLFLTLPFETIHRTGVLLPLFAEECEAGFEEGLAPSEIILRFRNRHASSLSDDDLVDLLFRFIQYVERQVVLFDALEDAAFEALNDPGGEGSISRLVDRADDAEASEMGDRLDNFALRIVLTAHPTQFYPNDVLGIITELDHAVRDADVSGVKRLLMQLGRTPFVRREKPTPLEEAEGLIWHLENVFFDAVPEVMRRVREALGQADDGSGRPIEQRPPGYPAETRRADQPLIRIGFWPGGDRDGNPFVDAATTIQVADELRAAVIRRYRGDVRRLRRRLTFRGIAEAVDAILVRLAGPNGGYHEAGGLLDDLISVRDRLVRDHDSLFVWEVDAVIEKVRLFGFSFASIDIRQDSSVHDELFELIAPGVSGVDGVFELIRSADPIDPATLDDPIHRDVLESLDAVRKIQQRGGESAAHRYVISHSRGPEDVLKVMAFARFAGWEDLSGLDIVPLFETVDDLRHADDTMSALFGHAEYREHLRSRGDRQTVMLGFSDGTKDGGFLAANWNIYRAKEALTAVARGAGVEISFFDGRGGPPARGGGKTRAFYASLGSTIEVNDIQLTIQGQTITSNFGTPESAAYNMEQLLSAGLGHDDEPGGSEDLSDADRRVLDELSSLSLEAYRDLRADDRFLPYLRRFGPLDFYGKANIGSRPSRRSPGTEMTLDDLRAIPFVGTWNQMKQNVPGFYGFGTALEAFEVDGRLDEVRGLYRRSAFFRALVENSMMSLTKCFFPLTEYLSDDSEFGSFRERIRREYSRSVRLLLAVSGQGELLASNAVGRRSIALREEIVRPLLVIQQYALARLRGFRGDTVADGASGADSLTAATRDKQSTDSESSGVESDAAAAESLVVRAMVGIINAGRNSA